MSRSEQIVYPPGEILNPILGKTDYEYVILWMLTNNEVCEWSDFTAEISESTLSGHLKKLKNKEYIEKPEKGKYQITPAGRERFSELTFDRKSGKRKLKYPPKLILKRRNYDHWILWMLYNNYSCKWSDFKQEPININQSSLSSNLNTLIDNGFIVRENKEYVITPLGKTEYFSILKKYDLDRQSILEQESNRIEGITEKTRELFKRYKIENDELKFRYLDHVLKLSYSKVEAMLSSEEDFNKILLYLSINHPNQYPDYISPNEFSTKYKIDITTLNYYIREIVENEFFQIKFFKLVDEKEGKTYFFQKGEPLEKILNATVEKYITKFTYLNKFQENPTIDIELLLDNILNDISGNLFNRNLKTSLKNFLPEYIKYLAYKIETERKLMGREAKLEGFVWQNIFEEFQTFEPSSSLIIGDEEDQYSYSLSQETFEVLNVTFISKLNFLKTSEVLDTYNFNQLEVFNEIHKKLYRNKVSKAQEIFENYDQALKPLAQLVIRDMIVTESNNFEESIKISKQIIKKFPKDFIGYLLQSITYTLMDKYEEALAVIEEGEKEAFSILLICQKAQILVKIAEVEEALNIINDLLVQQPNNLTLLRTKFMIYLTHWNCCINNVEEPYDTINLALKLSPNDKEILLLKSMFYLTTSKYKEAKRFIRKEIDLNILKKNPRIDAATFFVMTYSYTARGKFEKALEIVNQFSHNYPNHPIFYFTKALLLGYNLVYKFKLQESNLDTFLELIKKAISQEPVKYNIVKYLMLQATILQGISQFEKATETIEEAIKIIPHLYQLYSIKAYFLVTGGNHLEALQEIDQFTEKYPKTKKYSNLTKSFILAEKMKKYDEALVVIDESIKLYPKNVKFVNNKVLFL
ncbi:MAG: hypothetical protein ACFFBI_14985, partial [Promethearchaeota archaeon]